MTDPVHKRDIRYSSDDGHPWEEDNKASQAIYAATKKEPTVRMPGEFLYGKPLKWYFDIIVWPMFILLIVEIGVRVMQAKYFTTVKPEIFEYVINFARAFLLSYLTIVAIKQSSAGKKQTLTAVTIGGILVGLVLAVFQLFWYFELWTFFNLLGQPLLLGLEGLVISWLIITILRKK